MASSEHKTSAELEQEVEAQRHRVEATIGQIQDKLSPGQMVDELLAYAKNSGGGDFIANLGKSVSTNPIPVALLGVSLVWLMARQETPTATPTPLDNPRQTWGAGDGTYGGTLDEGFEYATVSGGLQHVGHSTGDAGERYSEFTDDAGRKFRALTDSLGHRAGHFIDEAGKTVHGFRDAAGQRVRDVRDQSGALMDAATGWVSDTWGSADEAVRGAGDRLGDGRNTLRQGAGQAGAEAQQQASQLGKTLLGVLHDQPLVGGALAFAVGAAIASALPHTAQEDRAFGEAADKLRQQAGEAASEAYDEGKEQVADLYEQVTDKAEELYDQVKSGATAEGAATSPPA